jgi:hypothetical protein
MTFLDPALLLPRQPVKDLTKPGVSYLSRKMMSFRLISNSSPDRIPGHCLQKEYRHVPVSCFGRRMCNYLNRPTQFRDLKGLVAY